MKLWLVVCKFGIRRSPAIASIAMDMAEERGIRDFSVDYRNSRAVDASTCEEYDKIFVTGRGICRSLVRKGIEKMRIVDLNVRENIFVPTRKMRDYIKEYVTEKLKPYIDGLEKNE
jgi:hypothetical protein